jgi:hypothetical protein
MACGMKSRGLFDVLSQNLLGVTEKRHERLVMIADDTADTGTFVPGCKFGVLLTLRCALWACCVRSTYI